MICRFCWISTLILFIFLLYNNVECQNKVWFTIEMPSRSFYGFDPPTDKKRWQKAQMMAAGNDKILLKRIAKIFPNPMDFLDGDKQFRRIHQMIDIYVDDKYWLRPILNNSKIETRVEFDKYVPISNDEWKYSKRIPIVSIGKV